MGVRTLKKVGSFVDLWPRIDFPSFSRILFLSRPTARMPSLSCKTLEKNAPFSKKKETWVFLLKMTFSDSPAINLNPCWGEIWYSRSRHPSLSLFQIAQKFKHFSLFPPAQVDCSNGQIGYGRRRKRDLVLKYFRNNCLNFEWEFTCFFSFPLGVRRPRPQPRLRGQHGDGGEGGGGACGGEAGSVGGERSGLRRKVYFSKISTFKWVLFIKCLWVN